MSRKRLDIVGERFGHLTVIEPTTYRGTGRNGNLHYLCRCDCGNQIIVRSDNLKTGHSTCCCECSSNGTVSIFAMVGGKYGLV